MMSRYNVGGTAQWLFQLSTGLAAKGIENRLIIGNCPNGELEDFRLANLDYRRIEGLGPKASFKDTLKSFNQLRNEIKNYRPDIVNTHTSKAGLIGRLAAYSIKPRPRIVHTYHGHVLSGYFSFPIEFSIRIIETALSYITDYFLVSGQKVLNDLRKSKIIRYTNFLDVWPSVPDYVLSNGSDLRKRLGIPSGSIVVGWLGRKVPIKRIDRIIEIARSMPEITFLIAGDGEIKELPNVRREFIEDQENIIELGFTSPSEMWSACDICILTSDNEAIPISPIEAALATVPIVAVDAGSTKEIVLNNETGLLCSKDINELVKSIQMLASDSELRSEMGQRARDYALKKFSPESAVDRQIAGYKNALKDQIK